MLKSSSKIVNKLPFNVFSVPATYSNLTFRLTGIFFKSADITDSFLRPLRSASLTYTESRLKSTTDKLLFSAKCSCHNTFQGNAEL